MKSMSGLLLVACAILAIVSTPSKGLQPAGSVAISYDGSWWLSISQRQRLGFVYGFEVCYRNLVDGSVFNESDFAYATRITEYFQTHPELPSEPTDRILLQMARPPYAKPLRRPSMPNETSEELAEKWGAHNDGQEWRGTGSFHLGYIQGFLECYSKHTPQQRGTFSRLPEWYVKVIAYWYGTGADPDEINVRRRYEKVPEVLFRFRDKPEAK